MFRTHAPSLVCEYIVEILMGKRIGKNYPIPADELCVQIVTFE